MKKFVALFVALTFFVSGISTPFSRAELATPRLDQPLLIHIQVAHRQVESEKNIQPLLKDLSKKYGVKLFLLEGAANRLHPELFRFFPQDQELDQKITNALVEKGELTGAEAFLINSSDQFEGWGIEDLDLYRKNREAFKAVIQNQKSSQQILNSMRMNILKSIQSHELNNFIQTAETYHEKKLSLVEWLEFLRKAVSTVDFNDPREQKTWPMLIRYFKLKALSLDERALEKEKQAFFAEFGTQDLNPSSQVRFFFEKLYDRLPADYSFSKYPNLRLDIQRQILVSELDGKRLFREIDTLEHQIEERLAKSSKDKSALKDLRDYRLLKKLAHLELTREEWEQIRTPDSRLQTLGKKAGVWGLESGVSSASSFYRLAEVREAHFLEHIQKILKSEKQNRAILITGGFHAEGLKASIQQAGFSYLPVTPKLTEIDDSHTNYLRSILGERKIEKAQLEAVLRTDLDSITGLDDSDFARDIEDSIRTISVETVTKERPKDAKELISVIDHSRLVTRLKNAASLGTPSRRIRLDELGGKIKLGKSNNRISFAGQGPVVVPAVTLWAMKNGGAAQANTMAVQLREQLRTGRVLVLSSEQNQAQVPAEAFLDNLMKIVGLRPSLIREPLMNDIHHGAADQRRGVDYSDSEKLIAQRFQQLDATVSFPGGESFIDLMIRQKKLVEQLNARYGGKGIHVILFGHAMQMAALRAILGDPRLLNAQAQIDWRNAAIPNGEPALLFRPQGSSLGDAEVSKYLEGKLQGWDRSRFVEALKNDRDLRLQVIQERIRRIEAGEKFPISPEAEKILSDALIHFSSVIISHPNPDNVSAMRVQDARKGFQALLERGELEDIALENLWRLNEDWQRIQTKRYDRLPPDVLKKSSVKRPSSRYKPGWLYEPVLYPKSQASSLGIAPPGNIKLLVVKDKQAMAPEVAKRLIRVHQRKPDAFDSFATGGTMEDVYSEVVREFERDKTIDFSGGTTANLDEYRRMEDVELDEYRGKGSPYDRERYERFFPQTYRYYMNVKFFDELMRIDSSRAFRPGNTHVFDALAEDSGKEIERFLKLIRGADGKSRIDWQLLGIGSDGHYAFLEPAVVINQKFLNELGKEDFQASPTFKKVRDFNEFFIEEDVPQSELPRIISRILALRSQARSHLGDFPDLVEHLRKSRIKFFESRNQTPPPELISDRALKSELKNFGARILETQETTFYVSWDVIPAEAGIQSLSKDTGSRVKPGMTTSGNDNKIRFQKREDFFGSPAKEVSLAIPTALDNSRYFEFLYEIPIKALTQTGIVREAKEIVLAATGAGKAEAIFHVLAQPISPEWPASILQGHANVTFIIDEAAAALIPPAIRKKAEQAYAASAASLGGTVWGEGSRKKPDDFDWLKVRVKKFEERLVAVTKQEELAPLIQEMTNFKKHTVEKLWAAKKDSEIERAMDELNTFLKRAKKLDPVAPVDAIVARAALDEFVAMPFDMAQRPFEKIDDRLIDLKKEVGWWASSKKIKDEFEKAEKAVRQSINAIRQKSLRLRDVIQVANVMDEFMKFFDVQIKEGNIKKTDKKQQLIDLLEADLKLLKEFKPELFSFNLKFMGGRTESYEVIAILDSGSRVWPASANRLGVFGNPGTGSGEMTFKGAKQLFLNLPPGWKILMMPQDSYLTPGAYDKVKAMRTDALSLKAASSLGSKDEDVYAHVWQQGYESAFGHSTPKEQENFWFYYFMNLKERNPKARILDLGTGTMYVPDVALDASEQFEVHGVDSVPIPQDKIPAGAHFHLLNAEELAHREPFLDNSFDVVTSQHGIEYSDMDKTLEGIHRVLSPGGEVVFLMHHKNSELIRVAKKELRGQEILKNTQIIDRLRDFFGDRSSENIDRLGKAEGEVNRLLAEAQAQNDKVVEEILTRTNQFLDALAKVPYHEGSKYVDEFEREVHSGIEHKQRMIRSAQFGKGDEPKLKELMTRHDFEVDQLGVLRDEDGIGGWTVKMHKPKAAASLGAAHESREDQTPESAFTEMWADGKDNAFGDQLPAPIRQFWLAFFRKVKRSNPKARILDFGTGNMPVPKLARKASRRFDIHGVDIAEPKLNGELESLNLHFHRINGALPETEPFRAQSFDAVTSMYGIEYSDIGQTLKWLSERLRPGGSAAFVMHHKDSPIIKAAREELKALIQIHDSEVYKNLKAFLRNPALFRDLNASARQLKLATERMKPLTAAWQKPGLEQLEHAVEDVSRIAIHHDEATKAVQLVEEMEHLDETNIKLLELRIKAAQFGQGDETKMRELFAKHGFIVDHLDLARESSQLAGWKVELHRAASATEASADSSFGESLGREEDTKFWNEFMDGDNQAEQQAWRFPEIVSQVWRDFFRILPQDASILEVGTASQFKLLKVAQQVSPRFHLAGIDLVHVKPALVPSGIHFEPWSIEETRYPAGIFDAVCGMHALEYSDLDRSLPELNRILRMNGEALFLLHHPDSVYVQMGKKELAQLEEFVPQNIVGRLVHFLEQPNEKDKRELFEFVTGLNRHIRQVQKEIRAKGGEEKKQSVEVLVGIVEFISGALSIPKNTDRKIALYHARLIERGSKNNYGLFSRLVKKAGIYGDDDREYLKTLFENYGFEVEILKRFETMGILHGWMLKMKKVKQAAFGGSLGQTQPKSRIEQLFRRFPLVREMAEANQKAGGGRRGFIGLPVFVTDEFVSPGSENLVDVLEPGESRPAVQAKRRIFDYRSLPEDSSELDIVLLYALDHPDVDYTMFILGSSDQAKIFANSLGLFALSNYGIKIPRNFKVEPVRSALEMKHRINQLIDKDSKTPSGFISQDPVMAEVGYRPNLVRVAGSQETGLQNAAALVTAERLAKGLPPSDRLFGVENAQDLARDSIWGPLVERLKDRKAFLASA